MRRSFHAVLVTVLAGLLLSTPGVAQERTISVDDLAEAQLIVDFALSPDGNRALLLVERSDFEENQRPVRLDLVDVETGATRNLLPHRDQIAGPQWSPDGTRVSFVASAAEGDGRQVFVLPMDGGEARQVTRAPEGVNEYRWAADGEGIFYTSTVAAPAKEGEERHNRSFEVGDHSYLVRSAPRPGHLWYQPLSAGDPEALTDGPESIEGFRVSPDRRTLALYVRATAESGVREQSAVRLLDLETRQARPVDGQALTYLREFSPDGRYLAVGRNRTVPSGFSPTHILLAPVDGGPTVDVTPDIDRNLGGVEWLPDGASMLITGVDGTRTVMWQVFLDGSPSVRLALDGMEVLHKEVTPDGRIVFLAEHPDRPTELYVTPMGAWEPRRVTDYNGVFDDIAIGRTEGIEWDGPDGRRLNGVLRYPPGYEEGVRYPLVLDIHGGPMSASTETWDLPALHMAAQGWLVFAPNYRGSNNMGTEFQSAVLGDPADGPARDVMSGVEHLKSLGIVDESRVAVSGWSYGGFMTTWLAAHYDGWSAAVAGAAVTDWFDAYNLADITDYFRREMGGSPWVGDNADDYRRWSPITYAHQIETPTLILATIGDERVPITQSYKLFRALRDNGTEVRFIAYPVGGHFPSDPVHRPDVVRRWTDWIAAKFEGA